MSSPSPLNREDPAKDSPNPYHPGLLVMQVMQLLTAEGCAPVIRGAAHQEATKAAKAMLAAMNVREGDLVETSTGIEWVVTRG